MWFGFEENLIDTLMTHETGWGAYLDPPGGGDSVGVGHHAQLARDPVLEGGRGTRAHAALTVAVCVRRLLSRLEVLRLELAGLGPFNFHFQTFITIRTVITGGPSIGPGARTGRPWRWLLEARS